MLHGASQASATADISHIRFTVHSGSAIFPHLAGLPHLTCLHCAGLLAVLAPPWTMQKAQSRGSKFCWGMDPYMTHSATLGLLALRGTALAPMDHQKARSRGSTFSEAWLLTWHVGHTLPVCTAPDCRRREHMALNFVRHGPSESDPVALNYEMVPHLTCRPQSACLHCAGLLAPGPSVWVPLGQGQQAVWPHCGW
jgi:hypothetical protein